MICSKRHLIAAITLFIILIGAVPFAPVSMAAVPQKQEKGTFSFRGIRTGEELTGTCYYTDEYFSSPGTFLNPHLRTMSMCLALAAFQSNSLQTPSAGAQLTGYEDGCRNFEALVQQFGFSNLYHNEAFDAKPQEDTIGTAIASKKIVTGGKSYTLIVVALRGSYYGAEWAGNMKAGISGQAQGFSLAKDEVLRCIREYEKNNGIKTNAKIWLAGYSRGGTAAYLAAEAINKAPGSYAVKEGDIYCYTFEAPQAEQISADSNYKNIHNTVNPADIVARTFPSGWGFKRGGQCRLWRKKPFQYDDTVIPAPGSNLYKAHKEKMLSYLKQIDPGMTYLIDEFRTYRNKRLKELDKEDFSFISDFFAKADLSDPSSLIGSFQFPELEDIVISANHETMSMAAFLQEYFSWLEQYLSANPREVYAQECQEEFCLIARLFWGSSVERQAKMSAAVDALTSHPSFYLNLAVVIGLNVNQDSLAEPLYEKLRDHCTKKIGILLVKELKEADAGLSDEEYEAVEQAIGPILLFFKDALKEDYASHDLRYFLTLTQNSERLSQAHYPEVNLAWMMAMDNYY